jgi:hypothetical protein
MALVRGRPTERGYSLWMEETPSILELMKAPFDLEKGPISVFEVTRGTDEAKALAAYYLALNRPFIKPIWAIRIESQDLENIGIVVEESPGDTGVKAIDAKHRDLQGNGEAFAALTERIYNALRQGDDRIRLLGKMQITYQLQEFLHLSSDGITDEAKVRAQQALRRGS